MSGRSSGSTAALADKVAGAKAALPEKRSIADLIEAQKDQMERALVGTGMTPDRMARIALTTCRQTPALLSCTPESLMGALMLCAQLGLEPGGPMGQAWLIPRKNGRTKKMEVNFQVGWKGLVDLARRSGEIESIEAREVCEADEFEFEYGLNEKLRHRPADADRGPLIGAYCLARFKQGGHYFVFVSDETIRNHHESRAQGFTKDTSPWQTDRAAMYRKTAVVVAAPYLPRSTVLATAIAQDGTVHTEINDDLADMATPPPPQVIDVPSEETSPEQPDPEAGADEGTGEGVVVTPPPGCSPEGCQFFGEEHANCLAPKA